MKKPGLLIACFAVIAVLGAVEPGAVVLVRAQSNVDIRECGDGLARMSRKGPTAYSIRYDLTDEWREIKVVFALEQDGEAILSFYGQPTTGPDKKRVANWADFEEVAVDGQVRIKGPVAVTSRPHGVRQFRIRLKAGEPATIAARIRKSTPETIAAAEIDIQKRVERAARRKAK